MSLRAKEKIPFFHLALVFMLQSLISSVHCQINETQLAGTTWKKDSMRVYLNNQLTTAISADDKSYWSFEKSGHLLTMSGGHISTAHRGAYKLIDDTIYYDDVKMKVVYLDDSTLVLSHKVTGSADRVETIFTKVSTFNPDCLNLVTNQDGKLVTPDNRVFSGTCVSYYPNGMLKREQNIIDGYKTYIWLWYENGRQKAKVSYVGSIAVGPDSSWYENGNLKKVHLINEYGKIEGVWKEWYENGQLKMECFYKVPKDEDYAKIGYHKQKMDGEYKEWYENGQLKIWGFYEMGKQIDEWKNYDIDGNLISTVTY